MTQNVTVGQAADSNAATDKDLQAIMAAARSETKSDELQDARRVSIGVLLLVWIGAPILAAQLTLMFIFTFADFVDPANSAVPEILLYLNMVLGSACSAAAGFYSHFDTSIRVSRALANLVMGFVLYLLTVVMLGGLIFG